MDDGTKAPRPRALVAEDDAEMRAIVSDALRVEGFQVDEVGDGRHMWRRLIEQPTYDFVVSDVRLPIVDGLTVLEDFHQRAPRTPLVVMTAFGDDDTRGRASRVGAMLFDKPFRIGELRAAARRLFHDSATRRGSS